MVISQEVKIKINLRGKFEKKEKTENVYLWKLVSNSKSPWMVELSAELIVLLLWWDDDVLVMTEHVCAHVLMYKHSHAHGACTSASKLYPSCTYRGQMKISGVFFYHNLPYSLRQGISLNLKLVIQARLASQQAPSLLSKLGLQV